MSEQYGYTVFALMAQDAGLRPRVSVVDRRLSALGVKIGGRLHECAIVYGESDNLPDAIDDAATRLMAELGWKA